MVLSLTLCKKEELMVRNSAERVAALLPEIERNKVCSIAAEAVDTHLGNPELHRVDHCETHFRIVEVKVSNVSPILDRRHDLSILVSIPLRIRLDPLVVP